MKKMYKFGVHTSTGRAPGRRQRRAELGTPKQTAAISAELAEEAKSSAEISETTVRR